MLMVFFLRWLFCLSFSSTDSQRTNPQQVPTCVSDYDAYFTLFLVDLKAVTTCTRIRGEGTGPVQLMCVRIGIGILVS